VKGTAGPWLGSEKHNCGKITAIGKKLVSSKSKGLGWDEKQASEREIREDGTGST